MKPSEVLKNNLFCIVTGMEHSGTTVFANALKSAPCLMGGFECGCALRPIPALYLSYLTKGGEHWGLTEAQKNQLIELDTPDRYPYLRRCSHLMWPEDILVDKTPDYCFNLAEVMTQLPGVPVIVVEKSLDNWMQSNLKRSHLRPGVSEDHYLDRRRQYQKSLSEVNGYFLLHFEEIESEIKDVFGWLNLYYDPEYLSGEFYKNKLLVRTGCTPGRELFEGQLK